MGKVKVIRTQLNENLNGEYFNDTPSNTIFSFGKFFVTTNFDNKENIDYTDSLSSFVNPVTLETLGVSETQSDIIQEYNTNAVLNLDKSDLNSYVRYGSAYEFMRVSIQNIILAYPGSLFADSQTNVGGNVTFEGFNYDSTQNISTFYVPVGFTTNTFGLVLNNGNLSVPDDNKLKNLNLSFDKYVVWSSFEAETSFNVVGYTGNTINSSLYYDGTGIPEATHLKVQVEGDPFKITGTTARLDYHIRPNNVVFEEFRALLNSYEQNIVSERTGTDGFSFTLKDPTLLENGKIVYSDSQVIWNTSDKYNIDVNSPSYQRFLKIILTIATKYDKIKTDLIARFLTPDSLKIYDYTEEGKITKLLRLYGREFDQIRQFIDSLVNINKVTYDKKNNIPDQLIKNMADTFGWNHFSLVNEAELMESFLTVDDNERTLNEDILPAEIDIELWRRIINNTSYFWKSKGTRQAIKSMFLLIGIPEPFINITEYVYTVEGKIDPNTVPVAQIDFPSNSLPYDTEGYPVAPLETNDFYFQVSGDTDSGQAYLDVFRQAGFNITPVRDNKKSWIQTGATTRVHPSTPQYYQEDSKLVINTKEVDVALDTARGIEWDVFEYIKKDFIANSSGYTLPYSYVNISNVTHLSSNTFELPTSINHKLGDIEVRYNGILLNAPKTGTTSGITTSADYTVSGNTFTIPELSGGTRPTDVIHVSLIESGVTSVAGPTTGITIEYIVTRVKANLSGTVVPLPSFPRGDVQLTINGIALTKGTPQFIADYIPDPANSTGGTNQIIIQNPDVIAYLNMNPEIQISYMEVQGSNDIDLRSEVIRIDSFNSSKIYFNNSANKYVYKLNYRLNKASDVKLLVDGIALEPYTDYSINVQNPYEVFLPKGLRFGSVISAYYLVGGAGAFNPIVEDIFGLGDITELSFLEFLELVQRKMINAKTRKVVTDFKGGWYPTILKLYEIYLQRALLPDGDPLQSNGYTFANLYPFLSKYNAFFQRFVDQLLSATIILKKSGLLIRNSVFTKQKHWYKRGVNVASGTTGYDMRGNPLLQYFGDDGSKFTIVQDITPPPPPPTQLFVETTQGVLGSLITGGENIVGFDETNTFGIDYKKSSSTGWTRQSQSGTLAVDNYQTIITGLSDDTTYQYRAFIESLSTGATGNTLSITTPPPAPLPPSLETKLAIVVGNSLTDVGGENVVRFDDVTNYAVQYRKGTSGAWSYSPNPPTTGSLAVNNFSVPDITGLDYASSYQYRAYMVVGGTAYYGQIRTKTTGAEPQFVFDVITDTNPTLAVTGEGMSTNNQVVVSSGNPDVITERGIVVTQSSAIAADLTLTNPLATDVRLVGTIPGYPSTSNFGVPVGGLTPNTLTYYRAYVKNGASDITDVGYGDIETISTANPVPPEFDVTVRIEWTGGDSGLLHGDGFSGWVRLREGNSGGPVVDEYEISGTPKELPLNITFNNVDSGNVYTIDFTDVEAWYSGTQVIADLRWRIPPSFSYSYSSFVPNVSTTNNYDVYLEVKDGAV